jgi:hypothetical protein
MNRTLLWITVAVVLVIALLVYRSRRTNLNVDPHAGEEIRESETAVNAADILGRPAPVTAETNRRFIGSLAGIAKPKGGSPS